MLFKNKIEKYKSENRILSYIDESGFAYDMPRRYGYSKVGDRCYGTYNWNAKGRENVIGTSTMDKRCGNSQFFSFTFSE